MQKHIAINYSPFLLVENDAYENDFALYICLFKSPEYAKLRDCAVLN